MNRRRFIELATASVPVLSLGALHADPARALEQQAMPLDGHGFVPASVVGGSVPWTVFATTTSYEERVGADTFDRPRFSPQIMAYRNKIVRVNGFMNPLQETQMQSHFVLMAYPLTCPYCLTMGGQYFVEVRAAQPVRFDYDAILMEGRLELLDRDENGFFFRLSEARPVRANSPPPLSKGAVPARRE